MPSCRAETPLNDSRMTRQRVNMTIRSSLSVCHFAIRWPRASLSGGHFAISCAILLSFVPNLRRMARRIAIAILCAKDVGRSQSRVEAAGQINLENYPSRSSTQSSSICH